MTREQTAARTALACEFGPAIVWTYVCDDRETRVFYTDTIPTLAFIVTADGAVASQVGEECNREAWAFDAPRVQKVTQAMLDAVDRAHVPFAEVIGCGG